MVVLFFRVINFLMLHTLHSFKSGRYNLTYFVHKYKINGYNKNYDQ